MRSNKEGRRRTSKEEFINKDHNNPSIVEDSIKAEGARAALLKSILEKILSLYVKDKPLSSSYQQIEKS